MDKTISLSEIAQHNSENSCWIVIHNDVYDVTKFLNEHPGGADSLLEYAGKNGSQAFEDVGHSDDARELMKQYKIGTLPETEIDATCSVRSYMPCFPPENIHRSNSPSICASCTGRSPSISEDETSRKESKSKATKRVTISQKQLQKSVSGSCPPCPTSGGGSTKTSTVNHPNRRKRPPPPDESWKKYALLALLAAVTIGIIIKMKSV